MRSISRRFAVLAALGVSLAAAQEPAQLPKRPKIVVTIIIDQFRYDYLLRFRDDYKAGLARLLSEGAVYTDARYIHASTVTAIGHSTFLSGAPPSISGIIGNEWYERETSSTVTSVFDPKTKLIGTPVPQQGSSPRRLQVSTVGDELKAVDPSSKIISVSIKDRSAVLPGGHRANGAYWYDNDSNAWVTSDYYYKELPEWVAKINDENWFQRTLGAKWYPIDAKSESGKPFCTMVSGGDLPFCGAVEATPWGNELIEEFAERAVAAENLGGNAGTDILAVSFSSNDYVGHAVGPDSPRVRDISIRTDRLLGKLFDVIESKVGKGNMLVVLSADHGVSPVPEVNEARNMPGGRISVDSLTAKIKQALVVRFGQGNWILSAAPPMYYLNTSLIASKKLNREEVEQVAADAAASEPHIARVYTRTQLLEGEVPQDAIGRAFELNFFASRAGDIFVLQEPYYLFGGSPGGTTHGTPYGYDNHVPVIFMGPGIKAGHYSRSIIVNDIAPTLATLLNLEIPSGSIGQVLKEIIP